MISIEMPHSCGESFFLKRAYCLNRSMPFSLQISVVHDGRLNIKELRQYLQ
jgi:hypothetical protein